jgi:hypothetical protein
MIRLMSSQSSFIGKKGIFKRNKKNDIKIRLLIFYQVAS